MYIESIELKNYRNYETLSLKLDEGTNIFSTGIMPREKPIFWKLPICAELQSPTEAARTEI